MPKFIAKSLLFLIAIQLAMPIVFFFPVKKMFKQWAEEAMQSPKSTLVTFILSESEYELSKVKGENELLIGGQFYDVKKMIQSENKVILVVYKDDKESSLFKTLSIHLDKKTSSSEKQLSLFFKFFDPFVSQSLLSITNPSFVQKIKISKTEKIYKTPYIFLSTPPPDFSLT